MRKFLVPTGLTLILFGLFFGSGAPAAISNPLDKPYRPQPQVDLAPDDVVRIVVEALANNDDPYPDAGIETTFKFASPQNKVNTGPLDKFTQMVKSYPYGSMLDHVESEVSDVVFVGEDAYLLVKLMTPGGSEVAFAFRLSQQQDGKYQGMWMTDAVWPVEKP